MVKFNEVTWYSKLVAIIFFLGVFPVLTFYIGTQYEAVKNINDLQIAEKTVDQLDTKNISIINPPVEGCTEMNKERICNLRILSDEPFYTLRYDGEREIKIYKESKYLQTITLADQIDRVYIPGFMIAIDINFDGLKDLALKTCEGATGNICRSYFLFDYQTNKFEYSKEFTAADGYPNPETKEIVSHWNSGCAGECFSEETYKVENNTPILIKKITQEVDYKNQVLIRVTGEFRDGKFITSTSTVEYPI